MPITQYRHYNVNLTIGARGEAKHIVRSVYVPDCGPGTKSAAREAIRVQFGARRVVLGSGKVVVAPRKGALRITATAVKAQMTRKRQAVKVAAKVAA